MYHLAPAASVLALLLAPAAALAGQTHDAAFALCGEPSANASATTLAAPPLAQQAAASGIVLLSQVTHADMGSTRASDCWGYTSPSGREYAIICLDAQTTWVEITDPSAPVIVATKVGPSSTWRDAKVYQDHCYVVSEAGSGIQVFDMSNIDAGSVLTLPDVTAGGTLSTHNVAIDTDSGFLYRCGGSSEGLRIYDLNQSLSSPPFVGSWSNKYVHDAQIVTYTSGPAAGRQVAFCLTGSSRDLTVVDVTDKANPQVMSSAGWPQSAYSHQGWLDEQRNYFYVNDEQDESTYGLDTTTIVIDVSDPFDATYVTSFDNGVPTIGHNGYVRGNLLYEANNASGLRVFDLSVDPLDPPEVAWYDTFAGEGATFDGLWSVYPYFPSGLVIGSDRDEALLIWYDQVLVDVVIDAPPPFFVPGGQVLDVTVQESTAGVLQAGSPTLHYDAGAGWQSTPLVHLGGSAYEAHFPPIACGAVVDYHVSAQSTNGFTWNEPPGGQAAALDSLVATGSTTVFADDFEEDLGWVAENAGATAGDFDRGVPVDDPGWPFDPTADADGSGQCWLTENALGNTDVDNGSVRVVSPTLDLTGSAPVVQYDYYLNLTDSSGADYLRVKANDGNGSGWQTVVTHTTSGGTLWRRHHLQASDFLNAGVTLTSSVSLRFIAKDDDPQSTVEAGVDGFAVLELSCGPATSYCTPGTTASGCQVTLGAAGTPSLSLASGFTVTGAEGEGSKDGLFFFAQSGQQASPWGNGTSYQCVVPPVQRTPVQPGGGTGGACDATWSIDLNAWAAANPGKAPAAGVATQVQLWFRDPQNTSNQTTSLSDALEFVPAP